MGSRSTDRLNRALFHGALTLNDVGQLVRERICGGVWIRVALNEVLAHVEHYVMIGNRVIVGGVRPLLQIVAGHGDDSCVKGEINFPL